MELAVVIAAAVVAVAVAVALVLARSESQHRPRTEDLTEVRATLEKMDGLVRELERDREAKFGELTAHLRAASQQTAALTDTTVRLHQALAGTKSRGQWGERMADDVLQAAGLVEHVNYRKQTATDEGGIPDFTFLLPGDQVCHMDVKFPFDNYVRAIEAEGDLDRQRHLNQFRRDVRQRITELSQRHYEADDRSLDIVLLFIPNERVYAAMFELDPDLLDGALSRKVVLCSPSTLFAVLAVVRQAAETFRLQQRSREIVALLGGFAKQWAAFTEHMDRVGRKLDALQQDYDTMTGVRRRQLERQLDRVEDVRRRDRIPAVEVLAGADLELEA